MKQLGWGLIGCGDIAQKRVAPAIRDSPSSELIAVNRAQSDLAASFAKQFGARRWYLDWKKLLRDEEIDAVYIATPVHLHAAQAIAAAEAGKHVLCEKPMAMNVRECDQMIEACRTNKVKLGVAYYRHFYPVVKRLKAIIKSGEIGTPVLAQNNAFDREVEDTAAALFRFAQGACALLSVSHAAAEGQDSLLIFGSLGSIRVSILNEGKIRVTGKLGERYESHPPHANLHAPLVEDFVKAVLTNRQPAVSGETGRAVALIEEEIYAMSDKL